MDIATLIFLSSGLALGWSLGANDAANVFGTAVGTRMVRFGTAALIAGLFVTLGATVSGAGAAETLGALGAVNTLPGAFMAALAAALAVYGMSRLGLPVSATQAIVGAIIGWNLFSGFPTDLGVLTTIITTWIGCPILAALIAMPLFSVSRWGVNKARLHLLRQDAYLRVTLIATGAFGAYALGANNIANVMGVFVDANPFTTFSIGSIILTGTQQLFLLGGLAIALGIVTYSKRVMYTVGAELLPLSPLGAWAAVTAHSLVLILFASQNLANFLATIGLPSPPLVPISSSQAVVGAVLGIGLLKHGRGVRWTMLGRIVVGWLITPMVAGILCFVALFFLQNVFNQKVYQQPDQGAEKLELSLPGHLPTAWQSARLRLA
ncbi:MAG: inorganic phosphate transporter [Geminicoccaceae bacterium]